MSTDEDETTGGRERDRGERPGTALITGASSGIGLDLARLFARDRFDLVLVARGEAGLRRVGDDLSHGHGVRVHVLSADLSEPGAPGAIARSLEERRVRVDVLVNNAGSGTHGPFAAVDLERQLRMLRLNVLALTHLTGLVLPGMVERRNGRILNVASTAAFQPGPLMAVYYASKAYVLHFTEALREELRGRGVSVNALCPGPTATGFQKAAAMEGARLVRAGATMDSPSVARAGYEGLMRDRALVIPGARNRSLALAVRLMPRALVTRLVRRLNERART